MNLRGTATIDDLLKTPKDGRKYELVAGEIVVSPAGMRHAEVCGRILHLFSQYLDEHSVGRVYGDNVGIVLPNGNVRSPDMTFVRLEKLPDGRSPESFGNLVPDLTVEVLSPFDSLAQVGQKIGEYLECGVPAVWLVDPARETVTVYRSMTDTQQLAGDDLIAAEPMLPGFSVSISRFFK